MDESLIFRPKWNKKGDIRFLSLYTFNSALHKVGVEFIKGEKANIDIRLPNEFADNITNNLTETFGNLEGFLCSHPPRGHSKTKLHYARELSKLVADKTNLSYSMIFRDRLLKGSSSPKNWYTRNEIEVECYPHIDKGIILCDDVLSSGITMQACLQKLNSYFVVPIVLIYGDGLEGMQEDDLFSQLMGLADSVKSSAFMPSIV